MKADVPTFIREGGEISGVGGKTHYLVFRQASKAWYIQPGEWFLEGKGGGYLGNQTSGKYVLNSLLPWRGMPVGKFIGY